MNSENALMGLRVRNLREYQHLSREKLAEKANISTQFLADIENGKKGMTTVTLKKLCVALHSSADSIIFGEECTDCSEISAILSSLSPEKQQDVEQVLRMIINML